MKIAKRLFIMIILLLSACSLTYGNEQAETTDANDKKCMPLLLPQGLSLGSETYIGPMDEPLEPSGRWVIRKKIEAKDDSGFHLVSISRLKNADYLLIDVGNNSMQLLEIKSLKEKAPVAGVNNFGVFQSPDHTFWTYKINASSEFQVAKIDDNRLRWHKIELGNEPKYVFVISSGPHNTWMVYMDREYNYYLGEILLENEFPALSSLTQIEIPVQPNTEGMYEIYPNSRLLGLAVDKNNRPYFSYLSKDGSYIQTYRFEEDGTFTWVYGIKTRSYIGNLERGFGLYIDANDILWIGDSGWVNIGKTPVDYYEQAATIYRSPVFVAKLPPGDGSYQWLHGTPTADTPDGRVWFQSFRGTAWYQPKTGEWCMFSTSRSPILKDADGNLWMTYDNALYMLPASETRAKED